MAAKTIQYPFAYDENNNLVSIKDVDREHRGEHSYRCPNCGEPMRPRQGEHNVWHFAHDNHQCSQESYIHKTAKLLLAERFNSRSIPFCIAVSAESPCKQFSSCPKAEEYRCRMPLPPKATEYNLLDYYDLPAETEVDITEPDGETHYRPDVLLKSSDQKRQPIFIEVWYKHKSEIDKIRSGHRIIEIRLRGMDDLEALKSTTCFREDNNIQYYNFVRSVKPRDIVVATLNYAEECECPCSTNSLPPCQTDKNTFIREYRCPRCGSPLVQRKGYSLFYGCSNYPKCDYAVSIDE